MVRCEMLSCHEPAHWRTVGVDVCEIHARKALMIGYQVESMDGEPVRLDARGEIAVGDPDILEECRRYGVEGLARMVATESAVPIEIILGRRRTRTVVAARRKLCIALRDAGLSYPEIGRCIGRDHTSVIHLVRTSECGDTQIKARVA